MFWTISADVGTLCESLFIFAAQVGVIVHINSTIILVVFLGVRAYTVYKSFKVQLCGKYLDKPKAEIS